MNVTFRNFQRIHLVGIGGSGMSGIAEVLLSTGYAVSGSDLKASPVTERLRKLGATIHEGHHAENVHGAHVVVISSAVGADNVEVVEAASAENSCDSARGNARGIDAAEIWHRRGRARTARPPPLRWSPSVLAAAGLDPTFVVGGRVNHAGSNARVGQGEYMVVEADESDRSFLLLAPVIAVVTTIDREHLDQYSSLEEIQDVFVQFVNRVPFYGAVILCLDEPNVQAILPRVKRPVITYGTSSQADLVISDVKLNGLSSEFPAEISRRRSRHFPSAVASGNSQRAQCRGRGGRGAVSECSRGPDSRGPCEICRRRPPLRNQGSLCGRHAD